MSFLLNPYRFVSGIDYIVEEYGAIGAWSLRLLDSTYGGSAIRVRRTSDSAEQDIGFSGDDLDTASLESFCSGTDGVITTFYDQSGNGNNGTQTVAARQPKICSGGTTLTDPDNGLPAMQLVPANINFFVISTITTVQVFSSFAVFNRASSGIDSVTIGKAASSPQILWWRTTDSLHSYLSTSQIHFTTDTSTGDFLTTTWRDSSDNVNTRKNGSDGTSAVRSQTAQGLTQLWRSTSYHDGYGQEIILIHSDVEADHTTIENNINNYYSIF